MFEDNISNGFDKFVLIERISIKLLPETELVVSFDISAVIFSSIAFVPERKIHSAIYCKYIIDVNYHT